MYIGNSNGISKPRLRLSYDDKVKDDFKWAKECIYYYFSISNFYINGINTRTVYQRDLQLLYDVYNNKIKEEFFHYITNPYGSAQGKYTNFPAKIRPYNIIRPIVDLYIGEFNKRYFNYVIVVEGDEGFNRYMDSLDIAIKENINQHFVNILNEKGVDTGLETKDVELPQDVLKKFNSTYRDNIAIQCDKWIKYFEKREKVRETIIDLFKDWLITGEPISLKGIMHNEVFYERKNNMFVDYDKSVNEKYIEDGAWVTSMELVTMSEIIEKFYDEFENESEINALDWNLYETAATLISGTNRNIYNREYYKDKKFLCHCNWIAQRKVGILTYIDDFSGQELQKEVDEKYVLNKDIGDISIKWIWLNETWEGYYVPVNGTNFRKLEDDKKNKIKCFFGIKRCENQRDEVNNRSKVKLNYNGKRFSDTNSLNTSIVELCLPYQFLFIIIQYRIELAIAKSKMFALMDLNVLPDKEGWNEERTIYYADSIGMFFIDRNRVGVDKSFNQYSIIDLNMYQHITQLINIQDFIVTRMEQLLGITPQRKGQTQASDAVTNNERSVIQSSTISDYIFTSFEQFLETEYQGFIDFSKYEIANAESSKYIISDYTKELFNTEFFEINPLEYCSSSLGIFATNSVIDRENLKSLKDLTPRLAQNPNVKTSTLGEIIKGNSFAEIMQELKAIEAKELELAQQQSKDEQEFEMQKIAIEKDFKAYESILKRDEINLEWDRKDQNTYIQGDIDLTIANSSSDSNMNGIPDINEIQKRAVEREGIISKQNIESAKINLEKEKINIERERNNVEIYKTNKKFEGDKLKAETTLKVAKENKNKHDNKSSNN